MLLSSIFIAYISEIIFSSNPFKNEFNFSNVHGIMNISGFLQKGLHVNFEETRSIHDAMNRSKLNLLLIFTFYYRYLKYEKKNDFNLGIKTGLFRISKYNRITCNRLVGV